MNFRSYTHKNRLDFSPCDYAFFVDKNYTFHTTDLKMDRNRTMPVWLDWAIRDNQTETYVRGGQEGAGAQLCLRQLQQ